ncbi:MAG TPA: hypothetical protein VFD43_04450 [Planctomycetota bacterium]|nr:hypothetical protein [Planctomycetota bacterium]
MGTGSALRAVVASAGLIALLPVTGPLRAQSGMTELVSVDALGQPAEGNSVNIRPSMSPDGRYVTFESDAFNLPLGGGGHKVFVRDRLLGITQCVSVDVAGAAVGGRGLAAVTSTGLVAFYSGAAGFALLPPPGDTNGVDDILIRDVVAGTNSVATWTPAGVGDGWSILPAFSADGSCVAFVSAATNLVAGDTAIPDVYVRELAGGAITRVSLASDGTAGDLWSGRSHWQVLDLDARACALSADGRWAAFVSAATNLVPGDLNGKTDIFVHDRQTGATTRVSVDSTGVEADGDSDAPALSADGRIVAFHSVASNLVPGGLVSTLPAVYVHDRQTGQTTMVSVSTAGTRGPGEFPSLSADGRFVAFASSSPALEAGDTNDRDDVFRHDRVTGATMRMSIGTEGTQADGHSTVATLSADGRMLAFRSTAWNLVELPWIAFGNIYVRSADCWSDVGAGLPGGGGAAELRGSGSLLPGQPGSLDLQYAYLFAPAMLFVSVGSAPVPFKGGTLKAFPPVVLFAATTSLLGQVHLPFVWPAGVPSDTDFFFQFAILDPEAINGVALSNALHALTP